MDGSEGISAGGGGGYLYVCLFLGGHLCVFLGLRRFALGAPLSPRLGISLLLFLGSGVPLGPRLDTSGPGEVGWEGVGGGDVISRGERVGQRLSEGGLRG